MIDRTDILLRSGVAGLLCCDAVLEVGSPEPSGEMGVNGIAM
jgi:hypothetical protein